MSGNSPSFAGYSAVKPLASDPVATLHTAMHDAVGRKVVIKTLSSGVLPDSPFAQNLEREAAILASLNHPNIVTLYDLQRTAGVPWMVREWVDGFSLEQILARLGHCSAPLAAAVATQLANALAHAHDSGIIHRSIKPNCILVSKEGTLKLSGFSGAGGKRALRIPELIEAQAGLTTASYLSPESALGEPAAPSSDIFAVGVILYQMLTGQLPETNVGPTLLHPAQAKIAPRKSLHGVAAPLQLEELTLKCIAKEATDRFSSARELHHALRATLAELGASDPETAVRAELQKARLITQGAALPSTRPFPRSTGMHVSKRMRTLVMGATALLIVMLALLLIGRSIVRSNSAPATSSADGKQNLAQVRVLVQPWAHVYVNGQFVDDTPFAEPILLPAGTHIFRFVHPNAPVEQRQVSVAWGESITLEVHMNIPAKILSKSSPFPSASASAADPGP